MKLDFKSENKCYTLKEIWSLGFLEEWGLCVGYYVEENSIKVLQRTICVLQHWFVVSSKKLQLKWDRFSLLSTRRPVAQKPELKKIIINKAQKLVA